MGSPKVFSAESEHFYEEKEIKDGLNFSFDLKNINAIAEVQAEVFKFIN